jgi:hypothetical protein
MTRTSRSCTARTFAVVLFAGLILALCSGQFIVRQMDFDEKRANILDRLGSSSNGVYHFPENHNVRLSLTRTVPIPQAILDEYDRTHTSI